MENRYKRFGDGEYEHRKIMRPILLDALEELFPTIKWNVHHRDGNKSNNDIFNLEIMKHSDHTQMNMIGNKYATGNQNQKGKTGSKSPNWGRGKIDFMGGLEILIKLKHQGALKREAANIIGCCESNIENYLKRRKTKWSEL